VRYSRTVVIPTWYPSSTNWRWTLAPVSRCLAVVRPRHSFSNWSRRGATWSRTGRGRGNCSWRWGSGACKYLATVLRLSPSCLATARMLIPSRNTLCRITCTWSILSILSSGSLGFRVDPGYRDLGRGWIRFYCCVAPFLSVASSCRLPDCAGSPYKRSTS
jgi:hypothetical protein